MNAINYSKSFQKLKIAEAVTADHDNSVYGITYGMCVKEPGTLNQAIRDMAAQIKDNEGLMRTIIGNKAVDLIKKYNHE